MKSLRDNATRCRRTVQVDWPAIGNILWRPIWSRSARDRLATFSSACICTRRPAKIEIPARHLCTGGFHFTPFPNSRTRVVATATRGPLASKFAGSDRSFPICLCGDVTAIRAIFRKYWPAGRQQGNGHNRSLIFFRPVGKDLLKFPSV